MFPNSQIKIRRFNGITILYVRATGKARNALSDFHLFCRFWLWIELYRTIVYWCVHNVFV